MDTDTQDLWLTNATSLSVKALGSRFARVTQRAINLPSIFSGYYGKAGPWLRSHWNHLSFLLTKPRFNAMKLLLTAVFKKEMRSSRRALKVFDAKKAIEDSIRHHVMLPSEISFSTGKIWPAWRAGRLALQSQSIFPKLLSTLPDPANLPTLGPTLQLCGPWCPCMHTGVCVFLRVFVSLCVFYENARSPILFRKVL